MADPPATTALPKLSITRTRDSMSPSAGETVQTPDSKPSGAFAIFKSLTGGKISRGSNSASPASFAQPSVAVSATQPAIYGGPPNYEQLYERLKPGNTLADRISAAESLRLAVQDYPLSGVRYMTQSDSRNILTMLR